MSGYLLLGMLGISLAIPPGYASAIFPPAGIALAAALWMGYRILPAIWLGSFLLNIWINDGQISFWLPTLIGFGAALQTFTGCYLIRRYIGFPNPLSYDADVFKFLALGGPVSCLVNATVSTAVLHSFGVIEAGHLLMNWAVWWIGDTTGVVIVAPLVLVWTMGRVWGTLRRKLVVTVPLVILLVINLLLYILADRWERHNMVTSLNLKASQLTHDIQQNFNQSLDAAYATESLFFADRNVSHPEFQRFAQNILSRYPDIRGLSWAPRVRASQRRDFEERVRKIYPDFEIKDLETRKKSPKKADRENFFPLLYISTRSAGPSSAIGLDLLSEPSRRMALLKANKMKKPVYTGLIYFRGQTPKKTGIVVYLPIFKDDPESELSGVVACTVVIPDFFLAALASGLKDGIELKVLKGGFKDGALLYSNVGKPAENGPYRLGSVTRTIRLAEGAFTLDFFPNADFYSSHRTWMPWAVMTGGFLFSALLGSFLLIITGKHIIIQSAYDQMEKKVFDRTEELAKRERQLSEAQKIAKIGSWEWKPHEDELTASGELYSMYGLNPHVRSLKLSDVLNRVHHDDRELMRDKMEDSVQNCINFEYEHRIVLDDGKIRFIHCKGECSCHGHGKVEKIIGTSQDITERKEMEGQLLAAKDEAQSASQAKSHFLANMSHEIRTPLGAILGFSEILKDSKLGAKDRVQVVDVILRNGQHLVRLINEILDLSKIEAGHTQLEQVDVDLTALLGDVVALMEPLARERGLSIRISNSGKIPVFVKTDPTRLRQILINLIGNSIKFSERGSIDITVRFDASTSKMEFLIRDTGRGISRSATDQLFTPFMQEDTTATRRYGGSGLGLAISRQLARALGGDVVLLETGPGGSTFSASVRAVAGEENFMDQLVIVPPVVPTDAVVGGLLLQGKKVLLVEDNPDIQNLTKRILEKAGATIDSAYNGSEGVEKALHGVYDVVLMDIQMPEMDGYQATQTLREEGFIKPIIALTAHAMKEDIDRCLKSGCDAYLSKPIDRRKLIDVIYRQAHRPTDADLR